MNILTKLIFKKQMNQYEKRILCLEYEISRKKQEIRKLESKENELKELISYILSFNEYTIIKEETNKENQLFYIVKSESEKDLSFYMYSLKYNRHTPYIATTKIKEYESLKSEKERDVNTFVRYLRIDDICSLEENNGNGSILITTLINYATQNDFLYIRGMLSWVDRDHFDKLEYFYKKFGFEVIFNDIKSQGIIKLKLNKKNL